MAAKLLQFHPTASEEFKSAVAWYMERNETAADKFVAEVDRALDLVLQSPDRWPRAEHSTRRFLLNRFPFAVIYREKEAAVEVLAIAHGNRRPSYWKDRL